MQAFVDRFVAEPKPRIDLYRGALPVFDEFGIEEQIDANLGRKVWLKSGGHLIVDQSEALTAIDVNTGRFVGKRDLEETVLRTNLEAVREIVNQLRFRNIGGLIILDLIDMESAENRDKVYRALQQELRQDKAKTNILKISELGLVEMTRKRTRENLVQMLCEPCAYCEGKGYVLSPESVAHKILREIRKDLPRFGGKRVILTAHRSVAEQLMTHERATLQALERDLGREIEIRARVELHQEQFEIASAGEGEPVSVPLPWLVERTTERPGRPAARPPLVAAIAAESEAAPASGAPEAEPAPREFLSMSLLDDEDDEAAEQQPAGNGEPAAEGPVDGELESPILPRFREHEEGV
jgi:Ribonuclease G/E